MGRNKMLDNHHPNYRTSIHSSKSRPSVPIKRHRSGQLSYYWQPNTECGVSTSLSSSLWRMEIKAKQWPPLRVGIMYIFN